MGKSRSSGRKGLAIGAVALTACALVVTGCSSSHTTAGSGSPIDSNPMTELMKPKITAAVKDGDIGVSVSSPINVSVADGKLTSVVLTKPNGDPVPGTLAADGRSWQSTEPLGYNRKYTVHSEAIGLGGTVTSDVSFTTSQPNNQTMPYLNPAENETVGIAQPVAIAFDENIPDRMAAQKAITIVTDPPVEGAFYWVNNREVRWRPEHFWAPGTKVTVNAKVYGSNLGNGLYGAQDVSSHFTIGEAQVLTSDDNTKMVVVTKNGQVIRSMPTSMGSNAHPTPNGTYIVADQHKQIIMDSSTYGVPSNSAEGYKTPVDWASRMSYSGIFLHSAPWSVWAQGNTDTSHGCLNLSPANAEWVYYNVRKGDPVIVSNTIGGTLEATDGLGDWNMPWAQWKKGNANQT